MTLLKWYTRTDTFGKTTYLYFFGYPSFFWRWQKINTYSSRLVEDVRDASMSQIESEDLEMAVGFLLLLLSISSTELHQSSIRVSPSMWKFVEMELVGNLFLGFWVNNACVKWVKNCCTHEELLQRGGSNRQTTSRRS